MPKLLKLPFHPLLPSTPIGLSVCAAARPAAHSNGVPVPAALPPGFFETGAAAPEDSSPPLQGLAAAALRVHRWVRSAGHNLVGVHVLHVGYCNLSSRWCHAKALHYDCRHRRNLAAISIINCDCQGGGRPACRLLPGTMPAVPFLLCQDECKPPALASYVLCLKTPLLDRAW